MRTFFKKITNPVFKRLFLWYHSKSRKFTYKGISVNVPLEVFPPHFTISTKIILSFLTNLNLKEKTLLELGCGSGIISLFSASKGAIVTASDINKIALQNLDDSSIKNKLPLTTIYSDLFENILQTHFDYIIINPPYYPKAPKNIKEQAWFCGENFEYFERLFYQISNKIDFENIYIILSQDCDLKKIQSISAKNKLKMKMILKKTVFFEDNYIFQLQQIS